LTASNFPAELADVLVFEGGFGDNPADPGGATDFGITLPTLSHWQGSPATIAQLQALTDAQKRAIYRTLFWSVISGDFLPSGIDLMVFDMAVNGGPGRAAMMLQGCLGVEVDGDIGPLTLAAVNALGGNSRVAMIDSYAARREAFYRLLPTFATFGHGWLARVNTVAQEAIDIANAPPPSPALSPPLGAGDTTASGNTFVNTGSITNGIQTNDQGNGQ